jgi:hypothetical protein
MSIKSYRDLKVWQKAMGTTTGVGLEERGRIGPDAGGPNK